MDLITKDSDTTLVLFSSLDRVLENVEYVVMNYRPVLNGEHYLTGDEVCRRLCISKRTLQDYRDTGLLGYVQLPGKIIYRESEILDLLERHYRKWNLENMKSCFIDVLLSWNIEVLKYSCLVFYIVWLKASNHGFLKTVLRALIIQKFNLVLLNIFNWICIFASI